MHDGTFANAAAEWKKELHAWERGERPDYCTDDSRTLEYWEWNGQPPEREYYRPWKDDEATWFQVWETVSEGTPVTPPFATREELVEYLIEHGDFWQHYAVKRGWETKKPGYSREAAEAFVMGDGYAPSMIVVRNQNGTKIFSGIDAAAEINK